MDFALTQEQAALRRTARDFLDKRCPKTLVREMERDSLGFPVQLWTDMAGLGWLGLGLPAELGGTGGTFLELTVLMEELGRALVPGPFLQTVISALMIVDAGNVEQKAQLLSGILRGEIVVVIAAAEQENSALLSPTAVAAERSNLGWHLDGLKLFVSYARSAHYLLTTARYEGGDGLALALVDASASGIHHTPLDSIADDKQCEVVFDNVILPNEALIGVSGRCQPLYQAALQRGALGECARMVGMGEAVIEMSVNYCKTRTQFDRPIGSFQAVQHHLANMAVDLDICRLLTYEAACRLSKEQPCAVAIASAKAWVSEACRRVASMGHQVHGGVGYAEEHDLQLYFRRAKAAELAFGDGDHHLELVASALEGIRPQRLWGAAVAV